MPEPFRDIDPGAVRANLERVRRPASSATRLPPIRPPPLLPDPARRLVAVGPLALSPEGWHQHPQSGVLGAKWMGRQGYCLEDLVVGMEAFHEKILDVGDILAFADLTGDRNPLHLDDGFARASRFKSRIAHGMLTASLISTVLGMKLPGPGAIYVSQSLRFRAPVRCGNLVRATARVTALEYPRRRAMLACCCSVEGEIVLDGEAVVQVPARTASA